MKANKLAIIFTSIFSTLSLVIAAILNSISNEQNVFIVNVLIGIFASGLVALIIAIINYATERRKVLEQFSVQINKVINNYFQFHNDGDFDKSLHSVIDMAEFDYTELDNLYGEIDFLFHNKKSRHYIFCSLYEPTKDMRKQISLYAKHFQLYYDSPPGNKVAMQDFLNKLDKQMLERKPDIKIILENGDITTIGVPPQFKVCEKMLNELNGEYRRIMYPFEKDKEK
ncbi:hypothetical protein [Ruminococcus sp. JL13D9]|uniref:hypothetical protein n=1 Tax=Ruminococcus sp. JL13D9 TaxID=3233381 RepID=UPI00389B1CFB